MAADCKLKMQEIRGLFNKFQDFSCILHNNKHIKITLMLFLNTVSNSPCSSVQHFLSTAQQVARSLQNTDLCPI